MKKKYLVWGAIATIVGVGYYYWNKGKEERQRRKKEADDVGNATPTTESGSQANNSNLSSGNTPPPISSDNPFKNKDEVKLFQTYVEKVKRDTDILKPYGIDGDWGKATKTAWDKYGKDYQEFQKKQKGSSSGTNTTAQAKLNKDTMDRLYMTWGGSPSATKYGGSKGGRELQVSFTVSGQYFMPYKWSIIFFESKDGKSEPTYSITDGDGKTFQRGFFSFNGKTYRFRATIGAGAGKRTAISTVLTASLNLLTDRTTSLA